MDSLAYAMGTGGGGDAGGMSAFIPLILMFAIFYFLLIRPQQKKAKQQKAMLASIRKGDRIVTSGGLHGLITGTAEKGETAKSHARFDQEGRQDRHLRRASWFDHRGRR